MSLAQLLERLHAARTTSAAAEALFAALPPPPAGTHVLRTMLHRRDAAGYRALHVHEQTRRGGQETLAPTTSTWQWLQRFPGGLLLEVDARRVVPLGRPDEAQENAIPEAISDGSRRILSDRRAARVLVLPLPGFAGSLAGLLSVELRDGDAGDDFRPWWIALRERAAVAAPWLLSLPAPTPEITTDALVPVVGPTMSERLEPLAAFAEYADTILLRGETGTGKTMLARWVHARSRWKRGPFIPCTLTSGPTELLAGELYGWKKGAHSTATADRPGRVAAAEGGVLFIDEIGDLSAEGQRVLLELLDRKPFVPLGADGPGRRPRLGIVLATHRDLDAAVRAGTFRQDLFVRIGACAVELPPLRERAEEVRGWAEWFLAEHAREHGVQAPHLSEAVLARWEQAPWPGNLRELQREVERAAALALGRGSHDIELQDLSPRDAGGDLVDAFCSAGARFFRALVERPDAVRLSDADLFRAYVVEAALSEHPDPRAAFEALGQRELVAGRNHHAELKKQRERRREFEARVNRRG